MQAQQDPVEEKLLESVRTHWTPPQTDPEVFDDRLKQRIRRSRQRRFAGAAALSLAAGIALVLMLRAWLPGPGGDVKSTPEAPIEPSLVVQSTEPTATTVPTGWQLTVSEEPSALDLPADYDALAVLFLGTASGGGR